MVVVKRLWIVLCWIFPLIILVGCALIPQGIQNIFATKTPTATSTPTSTPTPTRTPMPPITILPCIFNEECPTAIYIEDFLGYPVEYGMFYKVNVPYNQPLKISTSWIAKNQAFLDDNLSKIQWIFTIDGQDYYQENWTSEGFTSFDDDPSTEYPGEWFGAVMNGWEIGEDHKVRIGFTCDEIIFDGWDYYDPGTYVVMYNFIPVEIPTATPTSTITPTATPTQTFTPKPTAIPYTRTPKPTIAPTNPPCEINARIDIENTTGGYVSLDLFGPMKFHFEIAPGNSSLDVCSGHYTYKAWGCGGSYDTGEMNSGEGHEFYCQ